MLVARALLTVAALVGGSPVAPSPLRVPYESDGACPFECCAYRWWTVTRDTDALAERRAGAPVAFRVRRGESVEALTGLVVTTRPGRAVVKRKMAFVDGGTALTVAPGEVLLLLHPVGEGYWKFWVRGRVIEEELILDSLCEGRSTVADRCSVQITEKPAIVWWARIRRHGREGWTRQTDHFDGVDACR